MRYHHRQMVRRFGNTVCSVIVAATLWLSGVGCVFCCSADAMTSCCTNGQLTCSSSSGHECCQIARQRTESINSDQFIRPNQMSCSLFPRSTNGLLAQFRSPVQSQDILAVHWVHGAQARKSDTLGYDKSLLPPNRGSTYLRCCALLI